jgi:hypothetical protein
VRIHRRIGCAIMGLFTKAEPQTLEILGIPMQSELPRVS